MEALKAMVAGCLLAVAALTSLVALPAVPVFVGGIVLALGVALIGLGALMHRWVAQDTVIRRAYSFVTMFDGLDVAREQAHAGAARVEWPYGHDREIEAPAALVS